MLYWSICTPWIEMCRRTPEDDEEQKCSDFLPISTFFCRSTFNQTGTTRWPYWYLYSTLHLGCKNDLALLKGSQYMANVTGERNPKVLIIGLHWFLPGTAHQNVDAASRKRTDHLSLARQMLHLWAITDTRITRMNISLMTSTLRCTMRWQIFYPKKYLTTLWFHSLKLVVNCSFFVYLYLQWVTVSFFFWVVVNQRII